MRSLKKWLFGEVKHARKPIGKIYLTWWRSIKVYDFIPKKGNKVVANVTLNGKTIAAPICIPDEFVNLYVNKNSSDTLFYAILLQHVPLLHPFKSYGMYVPMKLQGEDRPLVDLNQMRWKKTPLFNPRDSK